MFYLEVPAERGGAAATARSRGGDLPAAAADHSDAATAARKPADTSDAACLDIQTRLLIPEPPTGDRRPWATRQTIICFGSSCDDYRHRPLLPSASQRRSAPAHLM
jgi:hypothetical protein